MFDDRKRIQVEDTYAQALGVVAFSFAQCEWNAVWTAEKLQPGYINTVETKKKTAGVIAGDLVNLVTNIKDKALAARCAPPAVDFQSLVRKRNDILHGKPITSSTGDQILSKDGQDWTISDLEAFADDVTACSILLNDLHHTHLK